MRRICPRSEEHTSELQSRPHLVCRLLLEKKQRRFLPRTLDDISRNRFDLFSTLAQERAALSAGNATVGVESFRRKAASNFFFFKSCRTNAILPSPPPDAFRG